MKLDIPQTIYELAIQANIEQRMGHGLVVQRLEYQVGEYVCSIVGKELRNRKLI